MPVCCECFVLSGRGLCDELITLSEEFYKPWCVVLCDLETFVNEEALAHWGLSRQKQRNKQNIPLTVWVGPVTGRLEGEKITFLSGDRRPVL
jgi:hypothetical protein